MQSYPENTERRMGLKRLIRTKGWDKFSGSKRGTVTTRAMPEAVMQ